MQGAIALPGPRPSVGAQRPHLGSSTMRPAGAPGGPPCRGGASPRPGSPASIHPVRPAARYNGWGGWLCWHGAFGRKCAKKSRRVAKDGLQWIQRRLHAQTVDQICSLTPENIFIVFLLRLSCPPPRILSCHCSQVFAFLQWQLSWNKRQHIHAVPISAAGSNL